MKFEAMSPQQAAEAIVATVFHEKRFNNPNNVVTAELVHAIATACQHFSNEALARARRWNHQAAVKDFMVKFGQHRQDKPGWPPQEVLDLRILESANIYELAAAQGLKPFTKDDISVDLFDSEEELNSFVTDIYEARKRQ